MTELASADRAQLDSLIDDMHALFGKPVPFADVNMEIGVVKAAIAGKHAQRLWATSTLLIYLLNCAVITGIAFVEGFEEGNVQGWDAPVGVVEEASKERKSGYFYYIVCCVLFKSAWCSGISIMKSLSADTCCLRMVVATFSCHGCCPGTQISPGSTLSIVSWHRTVLFAYFRAYTPLI